MSFGLPPGFQEQRIINDVAERAVERHHAVRRNLTEPPGAAVPGRDWGGAGGRIVAARRALQQMLARLRAPDAAERPRAVTATLAWAWDEAHRLTDIGCRLPDGADGVVALVSEDGSQWTAVCVPSPWSSGQPLST